MISEFPQLEALFQAQGQRRQYRRLETLVHAENAITGLQFLVAGRAKMTLLSTAGQELLLFFSRPQEIIGDLEFFSPGPATVSITAVSDCTVLWIGFEQVRSALPNYPGLMAELGASVAFKLRRANRKHSANTLYPLRSRVISYLVSLLSDTHHHELAAGSLTEMAALLGTSYRHLNRVISQLSTEGLLARTPDGLQVLNWSELQAQSENIYEYA